MYEIVSKSKKTVGFNVVKGESNETVYLGYRERTTTDELTDQIRNLEANDVIRIKEVKEVKEDSKETE